MIYQLGSLSCELTRSSLYDNGAGYTANKRNLGRKLGCKGKEKRS